MIGTCRHTGKFSKICFSYVRKNLSFFTYLLCHRKISPPRFVIDIIEKKSNLKYLEAFGDQLFLRSKFIQKRTNSFPWPISIPVFLRIFFSYKSWKDDFNKSSAEIGSVVLVFFIPDALSASHFRFFSDKIILIEKIQ